MEKQIVINEKYQTLWTSEQRYHIVTGGRGSGKSFAVSLFLLTLTFELDQIILFTRYTMVSAKISIIPQFIEVMELMGYGSNEFTITKDEIINKATGSKIIFKGIKTSSGIQTAALKSITGVSTWVLDEAEELDDETIFDKIDLSVRVNTTQNRVILVMNPTTKESFIYSRWFEMGKDEHTNYIHTDYRDNIDNLDESILIQIEKIKETNERKFNHVILGGWLDKAEGVIFENWKEREFDDSLPYIFGMDFGVVDPTTLVKVAVDKKRKKLYLKECFYESNLRPSLIIEKTNQFIKKNDLIIADSAEPLTINEMKHEGFNIFKAIKGADSVRQGIRTMLDFEIIVDPESYNLKKELNNYVWNDKKSETPIDDYNHCFIGETKIETINGLSRIDSIEEGDYVLTSEGYRRVLVKFNNGKKQTYNYSMQFDTFSLSLCCTNDHKIKTSKGWKKISELKKGMTMYLSKNLMEKDTISMMESDISLKVQKDYIESYGSFITEKYLKDTMSTMLTEIRTTIQLITLILFMRLCIFVIQVKNVLKKIQNGLKSFIQRVLKKLKIGINLQKVLSNIKNKRKNLDLENGTYQIKSAINVQKSSNQKRIVLDSVLTRVNQLIEEKKDLIMLIENAKTVRKNSKSINTQSKKYVQKVVLLNIEEEKSDVVDVYDLMIDDVHEYIANGVLVHNCIDASRYACNYLIKQDQQFVI